MRRWLLLLTGLAVIAWAAFVVPLPVLALEPVAAAPVADVIQVGDTSDEVPGDLLYTAVQLVPKSTVGAIQAGIDPYSNLEFAPTVIPQGVPPERFVEYQRRLFRESIRAAAAMGLRAAGRDVQIRGEGVEVIQTLPGSPAAGTLQRGDVIVEAGGEQVELATELASITRATEPGEELALRVRRDGRVVTETVTVEELSETGQPGIGVLAATVDLRIELPVDVSRAEDVDVGGPSAGLMIALSVYDAAAEGDLTGGRVVAGTGTIDLAGNVGPISGITEKVRGAVLAGADVFLAPEAQAEQARAAAPDDLRVVGVATLQEAIEALEGTGSGGDTGG